MKKSLESLRSEGNSCFRSGNFDDATEIYQKGLNMMEDRKLDADLVHMKAVFHSNQAACRIKTRAPKEAVRLCNEAIKCDPLWEKPYVRRAECFKLIETQFNDDVPEANADRQRATTIVTTAPETYKRLNQSQKVFDNIKSALLDANRNEIIFVEAGTYHLSPSEDFDWSATGVSLIGASIAKSVISGVLKWESTVRGLIKRLTIAGTVINNNYNLVMEDVLFKSSESMERKELPLPYLCAHYNAKVTLNFCNFQGDNLHSRGIWCRDLGTLVMSNCWLDGHNRGVTVDNATCVMQNCSFSNCLSYAYQQDPRGDINRPHAGLSPEAVEASLKAFGLNDKDKKVRNELIGCYFVDNNKRLKCDHEQETGGRPVAFREAVFSVGFSHAEAIMENCYIRWTDPPFPVSLDDQPVQKYFINGVRHLGKTCPGRIKNCIFENFTYPPDALPGGGSAGLVIHSLLDFQIINNKFSKCNIGISLNSATKSIVKGNVVTDCGQGISVSRSSKPQVISNTIERCSLAAVAFHSAGAGHISKNTLKECGGGFVIQDECFPALEHNIYVNCVEQPDIIGPKGKEYPLGFYYTVQSQLEAEDVEKMSGKKTKPHDHKFICKAANENVFTKSIKEKQTKKIRRCRWCAVASAEVMSCSGCKMTNYCSETCQRAHWKDHSKQCGFDFKKNETEKKKAPKDKAKDP